MLRDLRVTLYDIFGYLLPGAVFLAAIVILFWTLFFPSIPISPYRPTGEAWVILLLLAYFCGHFAQALGNLVAGLLPETYELLLGKNQPGSLPESLIQAAKRKAGKMVGVQPEKLDSQWLYTACDQMVAQCGNTQDREVYQYREGFYRGLSVSYVALFLSLTLRAIIPGGAILTSDGPHSIGKGVMAFLIALLLFASWLSFQRYRRFARHRVTGAVIGFLALLAQEDSEE